MSAETEAPVFDEGAYMGPTQLRYFQRFLEGLPARLVTALGSSEALLCHSETAADELDPATQKEGCRMNLTPNDHSVVLIRRVDAALRRIGNGSYGWCAESGEPIGLSTLLATPAADLCIQPQERRGHRAKRKRKVELEAHTWG